jgi:hypothetical protein
MLYCPNCEREYSAEIERCPDCGGPLSDKSADHSRPGDSDDVRSVLVLKTDDYVKAQLLAGALEELGIPFWAKRLGGDRLGASLTGAITHVVYDVPKPAEIYVLPKHQDRAMELLRNLEEDSGDDE